MPSGTLQLFGESIFLSPRSSAYVHPTMPTVQPNTTNTAFDQITANSTAEQVKAYLAQRPADSSMDTEATEDDLDPGLLDLLMQSEDTSATLFSPVTTALFTHALMFSVAVASTCACV